MARIAVAIPTFRRPEGLARLLNALAQLETVEDIAVFVADNDAERHEGIDVCERLRGYRWQLDAFLVAERGIAQARNGLVARALACADTRFIAMLDDDEWPARGWLDALLAAQKNSDADVVRGSVLREFEAAPPRWARHWEGIAPIADVRERDAQIFGTGNTLMTRSCLERLGAPWFDARFGLTGGEDKDFFLRLRPLGARFAATDAAVVYEFVPASRVRLSWLLKRAYRVGNNDMTLTLKHERRPWALAREAAKIAAVVAGFPFVSLVLLFDAERRLDGFRRLWRAFGKLGALTGHRYREYQVTHGR